jgi:hypothetical protein
MPPGHDVDHDPAILDPLYGSIPSVDAELLADCLLDGDLSALTYSTGHDMNVPGAYDKRQGI